MNISKREKKLIILVVILAVFCVYYIYFLSPYLADVESLNKQKSSDQIQLSTQDQLQAEIDQLDLLIASNQADIAKYSEGISTGFDQPAILYYLEQTINQYARKVMFSFDDTSRFGQMEVCPVKVTMVCTYDNLKKLLTALADGEYFIKITSLNASQTSTFDTINSTNEDPVDTASDTTADTTSDTTAGTTENNTGDVTPDSTPDETEISADSASEKTLDIAMTLEFYNIQGDIPPDSTYSFDNGEVSNDQDIFY